MSKEEPKCDEYLTNDILQSYRSSSSKSDNEEGEKPSIDDIPISVTVSHDFTDFEVNQQVKQFDFYTESSLEKKAKEVPKMCKQVRTRIQHQEGSCKDKRAFVNQFQDSIEQDLRRGCNRTSQSFSGIYQRQSVDAPSQSFSGVYDYQQLQEQISMREAIVIKAGEKESMHSKSIKSSANAKISPPMKIITPQGQLQLLNNDCFTRSIDQSKQKEQLSRIGGSNNKRINEQRSLKDSANKRQEPVQDNRMAECQQSIYMENLSVESSSKRVIDVVTKIKEKKFFEIVKMGDSIYYKFQKQELEINYDIMNQMAQQFLQIEILIPLAQQNFTKIAHSYEFVQKFTQFLKTRRKDSFQKVLIKILEKRNQGVKGQIKKNKQESNSLISYFQLSSYLSFKRYSKAEILLKTIQSKITLLESMTYTYGEQLQDELIQSRTTLGSLQLLLSFQRAENYCEQKFNQAMEQKRWTKRRSQLINDRNWWISNMFPKIYV